MYFLYKDNISLHFKQWIRQEDDDFFNKCLENLGLCEKKGLDGQIMLYPVKAKEKKLEKDEFSHMIRRLYKVKKSEEIELNNVLKRISLILIVYKVE